MTIIVCLDRDGTINADNNYYLGSSESWMDQVVLLESVVSGIGLLNSRGIEPFILTNQSGVALRGNDFDRLNEERMHEVNRYIFELLSNEGARIRNYFACPFVDSDYVRRAAERGREIDPQYIDDSHPDLKPRTGMVERAAKSLGKTLEECSVYVIGDRKSDVELGLNSGGKGILIASPKTIELGDVEKVRGLDGEHPGRIYIAQDFFDASQYVVADSQI